MVHIFVILAAAGIQQLSGILIISEGEDPNLEKEVGSFRLIRTLRELYFCYRMITTLNTISSEEQSIFPIPQTLVRRIVRERMKENEARPRKKSGK